MASKLSTGQGGYRIRMKESGVVTPEVEMSSFDSSVSRVLIVYPHIPHYRRAVFECLEREVSMQVTFAADTTSGPSGIPTVNLEVFNRSLRLRNVWRGSILWQRGLLPHLLRERYDHAIFLGNASYLSTWAALLLLRFRRTRTYLWTIGWHKPDTGFKRFLRVGFYRMADALMLYGIDGRRIALDAGISPEKITVVGNSQNFAPDEIEVLERFGGKMRDVPTIGAVVRFTAWKRLDLLLHAVSILKSRGALLRVLLVGDGPERGALESLAGELKIDARFTGAVYDDARLHEILSELDLTVMPEVAGLTVIQSLSYGIPVVTVDDPDRQAPEFRAVVPGVTGGLYEAGNVHALADEIETWLARLKGNAEDVARACVREVRENWSPASNAARILEALQTGQGHDPGWACQPDSFPRREND